MGGPNVSQGERGDAVELGELPNPYDFANPVIDQSLFAGRGQELNEIKYYLNHARKSDRPIHLAVIGDRASGKTSLLNMIELRAVEMELAVARIDLDESDVENELLFYQRLFDAVLGAACRTGAFGGIDGAVYDTYRDAIDSLVMPTDSAYHTFRFPLQYVRAMANGRPEATVSVDDFRADLELIQLNAGASIAVLFDECDVLGSSRVYLQKLRNIFQRTRGYMLVLVGTENLFPVLDEVFSPVIRQFKKIHLLPFARQEDTRLCILKPLEALGIEDFENIYNPLTYMEITDIHEITGGRPYEVQLLCHFMFRKIEQGKARRMQLSLEVLEDVRRELETSQDVSQRAVIHVIRKYGRPEFLMLGYVAACCGYASLEQMWLAYSVFASDEERVSRDEFRTFFEKFCEDGVLGERDTRIEFLGDDFDRIYTKYFARQHKVPRTIEVRQYKLYIMSNLLALVFDAVFDPEELSEEGRPASVAVADEELGNLLTRGLAVEEWLNQGSVFHQVYQANFDRRGVVVALTLALVDPGGGVIETTCVVSGLEGDVSSRLQAKVEEAQKRARQVGADLRLGEYRIPEFDRKTLVDTIVRSGKDDTKDELAIWHLERCVDEYISNRDRKAAEEHAELALLYSSERATLSGANELGYIAMSVGRLEDAQRLFGIAKSDSDGNLLASFNAAVVDAWMGKYSDALEQLEVVAERLRSEDNLQIVSCLFVPRWDDVAQSLEFIEEWEPSLQFSAVKALRAVRMFSGQGSV